MILSRFRWYRRARGGYWAQVTAPLGLFGKTRWVRCPDDFAKLIDAARIARTQLGHWPLVAESQSCPLPAMDALDAALAPFKPTD